MRTALSLTAAALALLAYAATAADEQKEIDPYDQSAVPIEKQPEDSKATKIVLVAGHASHGPGDHEFFAGCAILMKMLAQTKGVAPVMARDGWPKNDKTFDNAKAVVFYMDGGGGHPILHKDHKEVVDKLIDNKVGFVNLHYAGGVRYLVMELVPGQSLAQRLHRGPLPAADVIEIGRQIAEALEAAHERGIIHRDLKPGNVMLTPEGKVKVLDFGLARQTARPVQTATRIDETRSPEPVTIEGALVGTPAYVSPEQARGQKLDRRCDLWALGCVLFEMAAGKKAFRGETVADVLAAVLHDEPAWGGLPASLPPRLTALIRRCLKKDLRRRLCDAGDARIELEEAQQELASPAAPQAKRRSRGRWLAAALVALAFAGGVGLGIASMMRPPAPADRAAESAAAPEWTGERLLDGAVVAFGPRASPDRTWLAFGALIEGQTQVCVMNLETGDRFPLTGDRTRGMLNTLSWSADSKRIYYDRYFDAPVGVFSVAPPGVKQPGGKEVRVVDGAECPQVTHDGSLLYCKPHGPGRSRFYLRTPGGEEKLVLEHAVSLTTGWPPGAVRALHGRPEAVFCGNLHDGSDESPERFLYLLDLTGEKPPRRLYDRPFPNPMVPLAISADDRDLYTVLPAEDTYRLVRIALSGPSAGAAQTLWLMTNPVFGMDLDWRGRLYAVQFPQPREVLRFTAEGGQPQRLAILSRGPEMEPIRLGDGRLLLPSRAEGRDRLLWKLPDGESTPLLPDGESRHPAARVGPDRLAFVGGPEKRPELKLAAFDGDVLGRVQTLGHVPADGLTALAASPEGKELYYIRKKQLWRASAAGGAPTSLGEADGFAVHPRERRLLVQRFEAKGVRLYWVEAAGGKPTPVETKGPLRLVPYPLGSQAIDDEGRTALVSVGSSDYWFWQTATLELTGEKKGELTRLKLTYDGDTSPANWSREKAGEILAVGYPLRSEMWRLTPR